MHLLEPKPFRCVQVESLVESILDANIVLLSTGKFH